MKNQINRRRFLQQSSTAVAAVAAMDVLDAMALAKQPWEIQLFTIPKMVSDDFEGTLKKLAGLGYQEIEFFGPYDFSSPETIQSWVALAGQLGIGRNAFYGKSVNEVASMLSDLGLKAPSVHLDLITMRKQIRPALEALKNLGTRYVAIPALMGQKLTSADDYKRFADEFNGFGKIMGEYGMTFVYHNHGYEHAERDGQVPMDLLLNNTDPKHVSFELDIFWMQAAGGDPVSYLGKYPRRFKLMHVKDAAEKIRFSGDGGSPDQWMPLFPKMADPGKGVFDLPSIISAGKRSGVEHFFLERDLTPTPEETLSGSINYFRSLK
ncbi:MAG: sugar phosphate isomerase/epimerase [Bacteroidetes bacterium]|nr:sugar phosphate isomerase/epimerase [Bacteroidota bacterium]